ncbi:acyl-CoA dehydrogenase family protein [Actinoplanes sp. NPDC023936]|uniref:acyl-CoA dehydrogenase family protein n=1 Tax=Actinoplanes sp. NPDC023936 TaxID=3154910 RepID=UPI0033CFAFFF
MRLAPSAEEADFAASLHGALHAAGAFSGPDSGAVYRPRAGELSGAVSGPDSGVLSAWGRLGALGVTGLAVPERFGGAGAPASALVVAAEELGHHAVPGPVAESLAAVPALLAGCGDERIAATWLPGLASGRLVATLTAPPWLPLAAHAETAGVLVWAGPDVVRVSGGRISPGSVVAEDSASASVVAEGPASAPVVAEGPALAPVVERALNLGALVCAAQLLGLGRAMLEASVEYARARQQFGGPIGRFQAVQHRLADVAVALEFARPLLYAGAAALDHPRDVLDAAELNPASDAAGLNPARDVSAAKVACAEAAHRAARAALQVHGAVGYTWEHGLRRWLAMTRVLTLSWGTASQHRARVMTELAKGCDERGT